jgi:hypothetical protein
MPRIDFNFGAQTCAKFWRLLVGHDLDFDSDALRHLDPIA